MGLFDRIELPAGLSLPGFDGDPSTIEWQTKSIGVPQEWFRASFHTSRACPSIVTYRRVWR
jgi:hypothetical protein